jgi:outer membrane protein assembly factor BamB
LFVLKTVNVVAAGKNVIVLDKANKKLWQTALTFPVSGGFFAGAESPFGAGPCVEHGDTLYVFDQAVLGAFDLATGNARWRVPSVGVVGLFFDEQNFLYVNTTSGNPDDIKYSRQIDISKRTDDVLLKLDPKDGKTLWNIRPGGFISYLRGKFIYTVQSYDPNPTDEDNVNDLTAALQKPAYLRIARIDPKNGRILWEHVQDSCPVNVQFDANVIQLIFKREVEVLKFLTF